MSQRGRGPSCVPKGSPRKPHAGPAPFFCLCLAACASADAGKSAPASGGNAYVAHAGAEVGGFRYTTLYNWTRVDDDQVVVWTRPGEAFLLRLRDSCPALGVVDAIVLDGFSGQVRVGLDNVVAGGMRCRIEGIRPIDLDAVRTQSGAD